MQLLINTPVAQRSSLGVRRYLSRIISHMQWPGGIVQLTPSRHKAFSRLNEILEPGHKGSILWTPYQGGSIRAPHHVVTVHDCINIEYLYRNDIRLPFYLKLMEILLNRAEAVVAISHATRNAILRNFSVSADRIKVIQSGLDTITDFPLTDQANGERPFVLLVTNALPHKNTVATCRAWARSRGPREGVVLRVVGRLPDAAREVCHGISLSLEHGLDDSELATAYSKCLFLIAPSLSEGHDLPVAEALGLGADVLCSDIDVHREYYDGHVRFFDPLREDAIVEAIDWALNEPRPWFGQNRKLSRTFAEVAQDYIRLFQSIEERNS